MPERAVTRNPSTALDEIRGELALATDPNTVMSTEAAHARYRLAFDRVPRLVAALDRVLARHRKVNDGPPGNVDLCAECSIKGPVFWPCPTIAAIAAELTPAPVYEISPGAFIESVTDEAAPSSVQPGETGAPETAEDFADGEWAIGGPDDKLHGRMS